MSSPDPAPLFECYECSRGTVTGYSDTSYLVQSPTQGLIGIPSNGTPCAENVEHDIANPPPEPVPVPERIASSQFATAIRVKLGLSEGAIYALISANLQGEAAEGARDLFERARWFYRANQTVIALATLNGNTAEELDEVFRYGATLYND